MLLQSLPPELIDSIFEYMSLYEISTVSQLNEYFNMVVGMNLFYSFCKKKFINDTEIYISRLMTNQNYFKQFYLRGTRKFTYDIYFNVACGHDRLEIAKWLNGIRQPADTETFNNAFRYACTRGHLDIIQWLIKIYPQISLDSIDFGFRIACWQGYLDIAKMLATICPKYVIIQEFPKISYTIKN